MRTASPAAPFIPVAPVTPDNTALGSTTALPGLRRSLTILPIRTRREGPAASASHTFQLPAPPPRAGEPGGRERARRGRPPPGSPPARPGGPGAGSGAGSDRDRRPDELRG